MIYRIVTGLTLASCLFFSSMEAFLTSIKAVGMGGVAVAFPQDALVTAYNPAGMAEVGDRLDVGLHWAHYVGDAKVHGNAFPGVNGRFYGYRTKDFYAPDIGYNKVIDCDGRLSLGIAVYNRQQSKTTYREPFVLLGTSRLSLEYIDEEVSPTISYKLTDCLDVGLSINYNLQRLKVNGLQNFDSPLHSKYPGHVTNRGYNYSSGVGVTLGVLWYFNNCISLGATYTPQTYMSRFHKYKGFLAHRGQFNLPALYSAGLAWKVLPCVTLAFDVQYQDWSRINALHNPLIHNNTIELLGSRHGPGFGWKPQIFYRTGINWDINDCWTVRMGYRHANAPVRPSQTVVNQFTLETLRDVLTCGGTWRVACQHELSGYFAWGFRHQVKGKNSIPPPFGGGEADISQQVTLLGISWGYLF